MEKILRPLNIWYWPHTSQQPSETCDALLRWKSVLQEPQNMLSVSNSTPRGYCRRSFPSCFESNESGVPRLITCGQGSLRTSDQIALVLYLSGTKSMWGVSVEFFHFFPMDQSHGNSPSSSQNCLADLSMQLSCLVISRLHCGPKQAFNADSMSQFCGNRCERKPESLGFSSARHVEGSERSG